MLLATKFFIDGYSLYCMLSFLKIASRTDVGKKYHSVETV